MLSEKMTVAKSKELEMSQKPIGPEGTKTAGYYTPAETKWGEMTIAKTKELGMVQRKMNDKGDEKNG